VQLGAVEVVQHLRRAHEDDAAVRLAGSVGERAGEEGLAGAGQPDEERVHALLDEGEIVECEVAVAELLAHRAEVEVEPVDGVHLGEARVAGAAGDRVAHPARLLLVAEAVDEVETGEVLLRGLGDERPELLGHAGQLQPAELLDDEVELIVLHAAWPSGGSPGSRVIGAGTRRS
jgi:hypothetical protein